MAKFSCYFVTRKNIKINQIFSLYQVFGTNFRRKGNTRNDSRFLNRRSSCRLLQCFNRLQRPQPRHVEKPWHLNRRSKVKLGQRRAANCRPSRSHSYCHNLLHNLNQNMLVTSSNETEFTVNQRTERRFWLNVNLQVRGSWIV